jgi:subtilisin family serine protease
VKSTSVASEPPSKKTTGFRVTRDADAPKLKLPQQLLDVDNVMNGTMTTERRLNAVAASVLNSGFPNGQSLWDYNITGSGQFVQVTDTGFDDASCWLRDTDSASNLTGDLNTDYQVPRSTWDAPTTDFTKRKVVQYIAFPETGTDYDYDYENGHGTHCAGTIAGKIADDRDYAASVAELESACANLYGDDGCAEYETRCDALFCPTCTYATYCNKMCGLCPGEDEKGTAPDAKLMVFDFGNDNGGLSVPNNYYYQLFRPAYDNGARISSNSWGSAVYDYDYKSAMTDEYIYDTDDMLILFAAGNNGGTDGDVSVMQQALSKNCMTVGAGESSFPATTVASFSSRGPTADGRLAPDVIAPGDHLDVSLFYLPQ